VVFVILLVFMIGAGLAASLSVGGHTTLSIQVCIGTLGVNLAVLLIGAWFVSATRPRNDD
jgi:hypothetical protein